MRIVSVYLLKFVVYSLWWLIFEHHACLPEQWSVLMGEDTSCCRIIATQHFHWGRHAVEEYPRTSWKFWMTSGGLFLVPCRCGSCRCKRGSCAFELAIRLISSELMPDVSIVLQAASSILRRHGPVAGKFHPNVQTKCSRIRVDCSYAAMLAINAENLRDSPLCGKAWRELAPSELLI